MGIKSEAARRQQLWREGERDLGPDRVCADDVVAVLLKLGLKAGRVDVKALGPPPVQALDERVALPGGLSMREGEREGLGGPIRLSAAEQRHAPLEPSVGALGHGEGLALERRLAVEGLGLVAPAEHVVEGAHALEGLDHQLEVEAAERLWIAGVEHRLHRPAEVGQGEAELPLEDEQLAVFGDAEVEVGPPIVEGGQAKVPAQDPAARPGPA